MNPSSPSPRSARPRPGRPPGPACPGLAVRLGRVARPDRLLRAALGRLDQGRLQREDWRPVPRGSISVLINPRSPSSSAGGRRRPGSRPLRGPRAGPRTRPSHFAIVFVFYTFWLGMVLASVVLGDVFRAFNPWRAIGRAFSGAFRLIAGQSAPAPLELPRAARSMARGDRRDRLRLAGADPGRRRAVAVAGGGRDRNGDLQRDHVRLYGPVRGGRMDPPRRGFLRLLRDVLPARAIRGARRAAGAPPFLTGAPSWAAVPGWQPWCSPRSG